MMMSVKKNMSGHFEIKIHDHDGLCELKICDRGGAHRLKIHDHGGSKTILHPPCTFKMK